MNQISTSTVTASNLMSNNLSASPNSDSLKSEYGSGPEKEPP